MRWNRISPMPELPEVESLRRILERTIVGRRIVSAKVHEPRLRRRVSPKFASALTGARVEALRRRAKYLVIELSGDQVLLVHLGMSGSITYRNRNFDTDLLDAKHDHVHLMLDDGNSLVYNDP